MTRWLVAPLLCALTIPQAAWAQQPASPPAAEPASSEVAAPAQAPEGPAEAPATEAPATEAPATEAAEVPTTSTIEPDFTPAPAPPAPTLAPAPPPKPLGPQLDKRAEPLLATGLGGFLGIYALTAYVGAASIDKARDINRSEWNDHNGNMTRNRGRSLLIPVAGPFIAMHFTHSARRKYWQAVNGGLQAGTLVMAILGARMYRQHSKAKRRAQLTASASPQGAQVGMSMRF